MTNASCSRYMCWYSVMNKPKQLTAMLLCLFLFTACDYRSDAVDPEADIADNFPNHELLSVVEPTHRRIYLLKQRDTYNLLIYKKENSSYTFESAYTTDMPFHLSSKQIDDIVYATVFVDNSIVKAERYEFDLSSANDVQDKITISLDGLTQLDTYTIKAYEILPPYTAPSSLRLYDENGNSIDAGKFSK